LMNGGDTDALKDKACSVRTNFETSSQNTRSDSKSVELHGFSTSLTLSSKLASGQNHAGRQSQWRLGYL